MENSIVRLVWKCSSPEKTNLYLAVDEGAMLHMVLSRNAISYFEDVMISYIGGTQDTKHKGVFYDIVDSIHDQLGDHGVDAVLSGVTVIIQKIDNDAIGELPCEKIYTYECDHDGEVKIFHE